MIFLALALALFDQAPFLGLDEDRKAFEGYRQCVLEAARQQYPSGQSFKVIFQSASKTCAAEEVDASVAIEVKALERAMKASRDGPIQTDAMERMNLLSDELLYEVANDFIPKNK